VPFLFPQLRVRNSRSRLINSVSIEGSRSIALEVALKTKDGDAAVLSRTNAGYLYYSAAQQLAHHAIGGCAMCTGDLLGSGTISGPTRDSFGSLLELTWNGRDPITLSKKATRTFLDDGDTVIMTGHGQGDGYRIGFGECGGTILSAPRELAW
jgi:fumarylacetoacetase